MVKINKKIIQFLIFLILFLPATFTQSNYTKSKNLEDYNQTDYKIKANSKADWTVMYYMCCDSYMYEYADPLLENLSNIGSTNDMNLLVLYDGNLKNDSRIYYIDSLGKKISLNDVLGWPNEVDMSSQVTFELFCKDIMDYYPADHYAFITYASGATGWQLYPMDDSDGLGDVTIPKFAQSLEEITQDGKNKIDVLQTSCCMSSIELAYEISPYVDYLITTQEHITSYRIIQRHYLAVKDLCNNTNMSPEDFSKKASENHVPQECNYWESYGYKTWDSITCYLDKIPYSGFDKVKVKTSVTVLNLSKVEILVEKVQNLSDYLLLFDQDDEIKEEITAARKNTRKFGKATSIHPIINFLYSTYPFKKLPYDPLNPMNKIFRFLSNKMLFLYIKLPVEILAYDCRLDLYHFTEILSNRTANIHLKNLSEEIQHSVNETVISIKKIEGDKSYGINIYFPGKKYSYNKYIDGGHSPLPYEKLKFTKHTSWDEFLKKYLSNN